MWRPIKKQANYSQAVPQACLDEETQRLGLGGEIFKYKSINKHWQVNKIILEMLDVILLEFL